MKKTLKSILSLVLALVLVFSLAACSDKEKEDETKANTQEETTEVVEEDEKNSDDILGYTVGKTYYNDILGYTVGKTYYNDYAGLSIEIGDEWEFYSEEEIEALTGVAMDLVSEDLSSAIEAAGTLYVMHAQDPNTANNINMTVTTNVGKVNAKKRAELQAEQLPAVYEDLGATAVNVETGVTEIDGKEFHTCDAQCSLLGLMMYQKVIMIDAEDYIYTITATSLEEGEIDEIIKGIKIE